MTEKENKAEDCKDIAMSLVPVAGSVYSRRKGYRRGFEAASRRKGYRRGFEAASREYAAKYAALLDEKRQVRRDLGGEETVFICPRGWDEDFWQKKMEVFVKEQDAKGSSAEDMLIAFLDFCINNFPERRLAETLSDLRTIRKIVAASEGERAGFDHEDIQLAIDFLDFYRGAYEDLRRALVAALPISKSCNFLVLGKTGVGKSSLLNALLGVSRFDTGTGRPVTGQGIYETEGTINGNPVHVFDSWGLETGTAYEKWLQLVKDAKERHNIEQKVEDWFHAVIYCIAAGGHRCEDVERDTIRELMADSLYVVVALTKADQCGEDDAAKLRAYICKEWPGLTAANVIETCVGGAKTRAGVSEPFGLDELKVAILANYRNSILALLPKRCYYLARRRLDEFCADMKAWIDTREWKYDENDNNRPFRDRCQEFTAAFFHDEIPEIMRQELEDCARYGRNLAAAIHVENLEAIIPSIPKEPGFWEKIGAVIAKSLGAIWNLFTGESSDEKERRRLQDMLEKFQSRIDAQLETLKDPIARKIKEIFDGCSQG